MGIEMLYHLTLESANGSIMSLGGRAVDTRTAGPWLVAGLLATLGVAGYLRLQPGYAARWHEVNAAIAAEQGRRA
jgi:branched-chain amino acid transport system permease protein